MDIQGFDERRWLNGILCEGNSKDEEVKFVFLVVNGYVVVLLFGDSVVREVRVDWRDLGYFR